MVEIAVTQNKSHDPVRFYRNKVRVVVNNDDEHGIWIDEDLLFGLFDKSQKKRYLTGKGPKGFHYKVVPRVAQEIINLGQSSSGKPHLPLPEPPKAKKAAMEPEQDSRVADLSGWFTDIDNVKRFL
jgi:hypothetical protein